ncbi:MAG: succinate-semialdehyde dehydrogenase [Saprospiraceae bacterium]|nr:MAG: succinate-semialdehyde dehydrogenase [Saprospiraceae bacterium]
MPTLRNPVNGEEYYHYDYTPSREVTATIERAHAAWESWRKTTFDERSKRMQAAAEQLRKEKERYAKLITLEMGKPIGESLAEVEKCAWVCEYYAENAAGFLADEPVATDASESFVSYQPLGVVLAVMPWNFPFWQVFRFAAPALMAGNGGVLKHASNVPRCSEAIVEVFREAGFPEGLFSHVYVPGSEVEHIIEHPLVRAVTLTGSGPAGRAVAACAGKHIKKSVLELGGSDAYLILADADVEEAARICAKSRLINSGQSCIGAKRFLPVPEVYDAFVEAFRAQLAAAVVGDPMDETTQVGPLARHDLREELHKQVVGSLERGARCILGGAPPKENPGAWYPPTILVDVSPKMPAWEEELFGPVAAVIRPKDEEDAIRIANASSFGLGAAVFTKDLERGRRIAREALQAGACFVNGLVKSDPRLPFGGIKESGYGRELSVHGIREFVNIKTVWIA